MGFSGVFKGFGGFNGCLGRVRDVAFKGYIELEVLGLFCELGFTVSDENVGAWGEGGVWGLFISRGGLWSLGSKLRAAIKTCVRLVSDGLNLGFRV